MAPASPGAPEGHDSQEVESEGGDDSVEAGIQPQTSEHQQQILRSALERWPAKDCLQELVKQGGSGELAQKLIALDLIGELGGAEALPGLFEVWSGIEPLYFGSPRLQASSVTALTHVLRSDSVSYTRLKQELQQARPEVLRVVIVALGKTGTARALSVLPELVGRERDADLALLQVLGETAERATHDAPPELASLMRSMLHSSDARLARAATIALGKWNDLEAIATFVSLLTDEDPLRADSAYWSLRHMSGLDLPPEPGPWSEWFEREKSWYQNEGLTLYEELMSEDLSRVGGALTRLGAHRLHRHESAAHIGPMLASENANVARAALTALESLDSPRAVPWLIKALDMPNNQSQRQRLTAALRTLTGLQLADSNAWLSALPDARSPAKDPVPAK